MNKNIEEARKRYELACEYLVLERDNKRHVLEPLEYRPGVVVFELAPRTVMVALICELLLKALLAYEGKEPDRIHKLNELYAQISEQAKEQLREYLHIHTNGWDTKIEQSLQECANCFVDLRYRSNADSYSSYWSLLSPMAAFLDAYVYRLLYESSGLL